MVPQGRAVRLLTRSSQRPRALGVGGPPLPQAALPQPLCVGVQVCCSSGRRVTLGMCGSCRQEETACGYDGLQDPAQAAPQVRRGMRLGQSDH